MLKAIKKLIPDSWKSAVKKMFSNNHSYGWSGDYTSWAEAAAKCKGYDDNVILEKVKDAVLKVKRGEARYERDSVLFDEIYMFQPLLDALKNTVKENRLSVVDFGGSLGSSYFQFRDQFKELDNLSWIVVEQKHFVETGNREIAGDGLSFAPAVENAVSNNSSQVLYLSNVLQYLEKPFEILAGFNEHRFEHIILDKVAFIEREQDRICVQSVPPEIYDASYPCWFFNEKRFLERVFPSYEIISEFIDEIPSPAFLDADKVYWKGFHFRLKP